MQGYVVAAIIAGGSNGDWLGDAVMQARSLGNGGWDGEEQDANGGSSAHEEEKNLTQRAQRAQSRKGTEKISFRTRPCRLRRGLSRWWVGAAKCGGRGRRFFPRACR